MKTVEELCQMAQEEFAAYAHGVAADRQRNTEELAKVLTAAREQYTSDPEYGKWRAETFGDTLSTDKAQVLIKCYARFGGTPMFELPIGTQRLLCPEHVPTEAVEHVARMWEAQVAWQKEHGRKATLNTYGDEGLVTYSKVVKLIDKYTQERSKANLEEKLAEVKAAGQAAQPPAPVVSITTGEEVAVQNVPDTPAPRATEQPYEAAPTGEGHYMELLVKRMASMYPERRERAAQITLEVALLTEAQQDEVLALIKKYQAERVA